MVSAEKMLQELGVRAKKASRELNGLGVKRKNEGLEAVAKALILHQDKIESDEGIVSGQTFFDRRENRGNGRGTYPDCGTRRPGW